MQFKIILTRTTKNLMKKARNTNKLWPNRLVSNAYQTTFRAIVQQKILYICARQFMKIKVAKELRVALFWINLTSHTETLSLLYERCYEKTCIKSQNDVLLSKADSTTFRPSFNKKFYICVLMYSCRLKLQKNRGYHLGDWSLSLGKQTRFDHLFAEEHIAKTSNWLIFWLFRLLEILCRLSCNHRDRDRHWAGCSTGIYQKGV